MTYQELEVFVNSLSKEEYSMLVDINYKKSMEQLEEQSKEKTK